MVRRARSIPAPSRCLDLRCNAAAGLFLLSVTLISRGRDVAGGIAFAVLMNMKHLFACAAPVYFVYLLRHHCRCRLSLSSPPPFLAICANSHACANWCTGVFRAFSQREGIVLVMMRSGAGMR